MRRPLALIVLCSATSFVALPARAQSKKGAAKVEPTLAEAKKLFEDGASAYGQGNYEEAIRAWQKSYDLSLKPLIFENIANAYERLGDARNARDNLAKWRKAAPAEEHALLDARIKNLDARIQREEEAAKQAAEAKAKREAQAKAAAEAEAKAKSAKSWLPGVIVAGVGGAMVIAGVSIDVVAKGKRPASDVCKTVSAGTFCKSSASDAINASNTLAKVGDALWITGAVAAAGGVALVFVLKPAAPKDAGTKASAWLAPAPGGVLLGGTF